MTVAFHRSAVASIDPLTLYRILWLRVQVFVVEQAAAYAEIDGRDIERGAELMWAQDGDDVLATLRVLPGDDGVRIGRVATAPAARGRGLGAELMQRAVAASAGAAIELDAQLHLEDWYGRFGFVRAGEPFVEDDIPHIPMRRDGVAAEPESVR